MRRFCRAFRAEIGIFRIDEYAGRDSLRKSLPLHPVSHLLIEPTRTVTPPAPDVSRSAREAQAGHAFALRSAFRLAGAALLIGATLTACSGESDGRVVVRGDVEGLDTIALRGDSLFARAGRVESFFDSLTVPARPTPTDTVNVAARDSAIAPAKPALPKQRAHLRGDSMARATALRVADIRREGGGRGSADTVRGVIALIGNAPAKQVVLRSSTGNAVINVSGMATIGMTRLAGSEVMVRGVRISPRDIVVSHYIVRGSAGLPAFDGRIAGSDGDGWWLQLTDGTGRQRIAALPEPLRGMEGTRVWIAMKPGTNSPQTYGVIGRR